MTSVTLPAGPRAPASVQLVQYMLDPFEYPDRCRKLYGDWFTIKMALVGTIVYTTDLTGVKELFTGNQTTVRAGAARAPFFSPLVGGSSLLTGDGAGHMANKKFAARFFQARSVRIYEDEVRELTEQEMATWPLMREFELHSRLRALTLRIILRLVLGTTDPSRLERLFAAVGDLSDKHIHLTLPALQRSFGPWSPWPRFLKRRSEVHELIEEEIRLRDQEGGADRSDILSQYVAARQDGAPIPRSQVRDHMMSLIFAGHETTATTLAWAFERLIRHPDAMERIVEEGESGNDDYLDAVLRETLRLCPVISEIGRVLTAPTEIQGYSIPAGTMVAIAVAALHRREDLYPDPLSFRPERFLDTHQPAHVWVPFGEGPRSCLGGSFAFMEMKAMLKTILLDARLLPARWKSERPKYRGVVIVPARGAEAVLVARGKNRVAIRAGHEMAGTVAAASPDRAQWAGASEA